MRRPPSSSKTLSRSTPTARVHLASPQTGPRRRRGVLAARAGPRNQSSEVEARGSGPHGARRGPYEGSEVEIGKGPEDQPAFARSSRARTALAYLQDSPFEPEAARALPLNPRYGGLYDTLSRYATNTRRVAQAAAFARRAVQLSPRLWRARLSLGWPSCGSSRWREGARRGEASFKGYPFNVWDQEHARPARRDAGLPRDEARPLPDQAAAEESDVLGPYAAELIEEAAAKLTAKYRLRRGAGRRRTVHESRRLRGAGAGRPGSARSASARPGHRRRLALAAAPSVNLTGAAPSGTNTHTSSPCR